MSPASDYDVIVLGGGGRASMLRGGVRGTRATRGSGRAELVGERLLVLGVHFCRVVCRAPARPCTGARQAVTAEVDVQAALARLDDMVSNHKDTWSGAMVGGTPPRSRSAGTGGLLAHGVVEVDGVRQHREHAAAPPGSVSIGAPFRVSASSRRVVHARGDEHDGGARVSSCPRRRGGRRRAGRGRLPPRREAPLVEGRDWCQILARSVPLGQVLSEVLRGTALSWCSGCMPPV